MHWPMQLSFRFKPGPNTRSSGIRQRTKASLLARNQRKAAKGHGPLAKAKGRSSGSPSSTWDSQTWGSGWQTQTWGSGWQT